MSSSSIKWIACLSALVVVLALGSPAWGRSGRGKKDKDENESGKITLAILPSFGLAGNLTEESQKTFNAWAGDLAPNEIADASAPIEVAEADAGKVDPKDLEGLPGTSGGRTAGLLSPVCKSLEAEGALVFWLEKAREDSFQMVSLLYLPERIQLESFVVSVNFEREPVQLEEGKLQADGFKNALTAALRRNLDRIILPEEPPADLAADPKPEDVEKDSEKVPEEEPAVDLAPTSGGGDQASLEDEKGRPEGRLPRGALRLGVIDFSRDFTQGESEIRQSFSETPLVYDFRAQTRQALTELTGHDVVAIERSPLSYGQIEAPANILAGDDPKAKEKRLARLCAKEGVDGLVFGHLRQRDGPESDDMELYLRLFLKNALMTYTAAPAAWPKGRPVAEVAHVIRGLVQDVVKQMGGAPAPRPRAPDSTQVVAGGDDLNYTIKSGDTLFSISKKCYPRSQGRAVEPLQWYNRLPHPDKIEKGATLRVPKRLGEYERRDSTCR